MEFELSESQKISSRHSALFGEEVFTSDHVFQWRRDQGLPDEVVKGFVDRYFALDKVQSDGRRGLDIMGQTLILEELSRCAGAALPFQNDLFNLQILSGFADEGVVSEVLENYRNTGRLMFSLAVSEPNAGSDTMSMSTSVETRDGKIILNGKKTYVNNGEYSPSILVAAIDKDNVGNEQISPSFLWLIPHNLPGIRAIPITKLSIVVPFVQFPLMKWRLNPNIV